MKERVLVLDRTDRGKLSWDGKCDYGWEKENTDDRKEG